MLGRPAEVDFDICPFGPLVNLLARSQFVVKDIHWRSEGVPVLGARCDFGAREQLDWN